MLKKLQSLLKNNPDLSIFGIRYFDGPDLFCDKYGNYKGKTLEESLNKFLNENKV